MNFCYLHPDVEAQGQCTACRNWICMRDYRLVKENIGEVQGWVMQKPSRFWPRRRKKGPKLITKMQTGPVIYCSPCYEKKTGTKKDKNDKDGLVNIDKQYRSTKLLMCNLCGEKLQPGDKFCPSCGESMQDEYYDSKHPLKGLQSSKTLR